jgi:hypothetical protein
MSLVPITRQPVQGARRPIAMALLALAATVAMVPAFPMRIGVDLLTLLQLIFRAAIG